MSSGTSSDTDVPSAGSTGLDLGSRMVIILGGALASLAMVSISSVLPAMDTALSRDPGDSLLIKQLIGGVGLAMMIGSLLTGFLLDRVPLRRLLFTAALVYVVAGTAGLYLTDLRAILASRMILGFAAAVIQITALTLVNTRLAGAARAHWMGLHISAAMICTIAVQPIAGFIGDYGWRWPFALHALAVLILPAVLTIRSDGISRPAPGRRAENAPDRKTFWATFPLHYLPLAILIGSIVFIPAIYAPFLLREKGLANPSSIALVLTADSIAGALVASQYGRARQYLTRHGAFAVSFAIAAAGTLVAALSPGAIGVIVGMLIYGFGVGWFVPNLMTAIGEKLGAERQAHAVGLVKAAHFTSAGIAVAIMEPISSLYGPQATLLVMCAVSTTLLCTIVLRSLAGNALRAPGAPQASDLARQRA